MFDGGGSDPPTPFGLRRGRPGLEPAWLVPKALGEERPDQRVARESRVTRNVPKDGAERAHLERIMIGDRDVVLTALPRGHANVASGLSRNLISETGQNGGKLPPGDIPRNFKVR